MIHSINKIFRCLFWSVLLAGLSVLIYCLSVLSEYQPYEKGLNHETIGHGTYYY